SPFCLAKFTFSPSIPPAPNTPHCSYCQFSSSPFPAAVFDLSSFGRGVRACRAISLSKLFLRAHRSQIRDAINAKNSTQVIDFVLQQLGKVSQLSCLNLARLALQILVLHGDIPIALHLH